MTVIATMSDHSTMNCVVVRDVSSCQMLGINKILCHLWIFPLLRQKRKGYLEVAWFNVTSTQNLISSFPKVYAV